MDFELDEDQILLRDSLQRLLAQEYSFEARRRVLATPFGFDAGVWQSLAQQGVLSVGLPEEHGGIGGPVEVMVVMEELGRALVLEPFASTVVLGANLIAQLGSGQQRAHWLPQVAAGECRLAFAHAEPQARHVLAHVDLSVSARGAARVLNGRKISVADGAIADRLIVSARDPAGALSLFIVDPNARGMRAVRYRTHDGRSAADFTFDEVPVTEDLELRAAGDALAAIEQCVDRTIAALCAEAVGAMQALNEATLDYVKNRKQFGQPIGRFQSLQHRMADMFIAATQSRSMSLLATGRCADPDPARRRHAVSAAKCFIGEAARFIGQQAVQLHGGMGMSDELAVSHYFKRLTLFNATWGDADHHLGVVSDAILAQHTARSARA
ncbi:MAG TPA: acyl-CoA dehydrogenase family protein [Steroidobacteraceae bacterium]|nr:acyl-CoA dehydrogenase family protein [Steroidobacteraceae bacterium]